jgi:hypothetical protein
MHNENWSKGEKAVARRAYDAARSREYSALAEQVRRLAKSVANPGDIWDLHDFLSRKRKAFDQKYNYRYSMLLFVFARLINEGWLTEAELAGLDEDKLARIRFLLEI